LAKENDMTINFQNLSKNLIIIIVAAITSAFITYKATISSALETNKQCVKNKSEKNK